MSRAIRLYAIGGPEVLKLEDVEVGQPGPGQARVRHSYVAVNFIDIYFRTGRYPMPLPNGLGSDAVGVVEAVGAGVSDIKVGDRVGYLLGPQGAYADVRIMPAEVLIPLPEGVSERSAATLMMKGMTAQYLFRQVFPLKGGETILYHAAAGGVGLVACQWARAIGVTMIGTVSTEAKAEVARAHGCAHTIVTGGMSAEDMAREIPKRVKEITGGQGVPVVYDSVGKDTLMASLDSLRPRGSLVSNGTTSGPVQIDTTLLAVKGSIWLTRPAMIHYAMPRAHMLDMAQELFGHVLAGRITGEPRQQFALAEAADAHRALESRRTEAEDFRSSGLVEANGLGHGVGHQVGLDSAARADIAAMYCSAAGHGPKPEAGLRWPTFPRSSSRLPQPCASSATRSKRASGSLRLAATMLGNGRRSRGTGSQPPACSACRLG